jgi:hypothetical protein
VKFFCTASGSLERILEETGNLERVGSGVWVHRVDGCNAQTQKTLEFAPATSKNIMGEAQMTGFGLPPAPSCG